MEEVGAQVASPMFIHGALSNRFCESPLMARKRSYPSFISQTHHFHHQDLQHQPDPRSNWNSSSWNWDSSAFVAKHVEPGVLQLGTAAVAQTRREEGRNGSPEMSKKKSGHDVVDENLSLNLGAPIGTKPVDEPRPNKRVRSGSPGSSNYPMCQVDECSEDLSTAKDYHRRHKVCEFHSKSAKALVGKQMQRFCQQCSRFHLLSEFDEGKRSCRRRLAGHNRRRRKTSQADDANSRPVTSSSQENTNSNGNPDIISLLSAFARTQGKNVDSGALPDKDQILQILSKINSLALPVDLANKIAAYRNLNGAVSGQASSEQSKPTGAMPSPSTMDLLTVLSATLTPPNPETLAVLSQKSRAPMEFNSVGGERSSSSYQSPIEDSDCHVQETRMPNLPLQLFSSSPENDSSPPTIASSRKYFSSDSSNPTDERSPSSSPVVQRLFPIQSSASAMNSEISICRETDKNVESNRIKAVPLELFRDYDRRPEHGQYQSHGPYQSSPYQTGYTSSSGSDHSPSSLSLDSQDRTCKIMFKLFDKDPSHLPGGLRSQIHNWLSNSPMEMESYIRPGCVVLSIYLSMPSATWDQLEEKFSERIRDLVDSEPDFWGTGRFLIQTGRKLASHDSGKINLCKSWRICSPELISVSPLAVVGGQSTSILLKGRNLISPRTKIHYTNMGGYISKDITGENSHRSIHDEIGITDFQVDGLAPANLGRCFIEVEDGFKGHSFPVIIADSTICSELRVLESELEENDEKRHGYGNQQPNSRQQVLHFLNELGWLFQGLNRSPTEQQQDPNHILRRYKFLFTFAVERDWCSLVKKLLDILMKTHFERTGLSRESLEELSEVQLLNRAVRRQCRKMVDLLIHYEISGFSDGSSKEYIFPPNLAGPGGVTPLHLAASTSGSDDIVDALTNDPQQIGLNSWSTLLDATGQSPHAYAAMRNNHSYNDLVDQKLADRKNGQVSVRMTIGSEIGQDMTHRRAQRAPCTKCAAVSAKYGVGRRIPGRQGVLHRPYIHSMLVIGAVCVCVCLFLRGAPKVGLVAPFKWENLDFGAI